MENPTTPQTVQPTAPQQVPPGVPPKTPEISGGGANKGLYAVVIIVVLLLAAAGVVAIMYSQKPSGVQYTQASPSSYPTAQGASPSASPINNQSDLNAASQTLDSQDTTQITTTLNQNTQDTSKF